MLLMSAPALKPRPAPVNATQRTAGSSSQSLSASVRRCNRSSPNAFSRSGRFNVIRATPSSRLSRMTVGSPFVSDMCRAFHQVGSGEIRGNREVKRSPQC